MASPTRSRFLPHGAFHTELHRRVEAHLTAHQLPDHGARAMGIKTAVIAVWLLASYLLLLLWAPSAPVAVLLAISLGLAVAAVGFNIQHDGGHGSYSDRPGVNRAMAMALDLMGGSSYLWRWKHNVFHHSNTNVDGLDSDIALAPFGRLSPTQPRRWIHRYQHLYLWPLYALLAVKWQFVDDFECLLRGKIGGTAFPAPKGRALWTLIAGKLFFYGWSVVIPLLLFPVWKVLVFHAIASATVSVMLAITFQLAHVVEDAEFPPLLPPSPRVHDFASHQVATTVDFAPGSRILTWYLGGLNYQIEHHLFPKVSHLHLARIAPVVRATCEEFGVPYRAHATMWSALGSHARWLRQMGRAEAVAA